MDGASTSGMEDESSLVTYLSSSMTTCVWYIYSGVACHMTGVRDYFTSLKEHSFDFYVELGDNSKYNPTGTRTMKFQWEPRKALLVKDVLNVLGL